MRGEIATLMDPKLHLIPPKTKVTFVNDAETQKLLVRILPHPHLWIEKPIEYEIVIPSKFPIIPPLVRCLDMDFVREHSAAAELDARTGESTLSILMLDPPMCPSGTIVSFGWMRTFTLADIIHAIRRTLLRQDILLNTLYLGEAPFDTSVRFVAREDYLPVPGDNSSDFGDGLGNVAQGLTSPIPVPMLCPQTIDIKSGSVELQGKRHSMEDSVVLSDRLTVHSRASSSSSTSPGAPIGTFALFSILDGHGGTGASTFGARQLSKLCTKFLAEGKPIPDALHETYITIDSMFLSKGSGCPSHDDMRDGTCEFGTTAALKGSAHDSTGSDVLSGTFGSKSSSSSTASNLLDNSTNVTSSSTGLSLSLDTSMCPDQSGSTAVTALITGVPGAGSITVANIGDSRCVLSRAGKAYALTYDHKTSRPDERARILSVGGVIIRDRVLGRLVITRAFGNIPLKHGSEKKQLVTAVPELVSVPLEPEDEFLLLACDGVWDVITPTLACDFVRNCLLEKKTPEETSKLLGELCLVRGSTDNVSVVLVKLGQGPTGEAIPFDRKELYNAPPSNSTSKGSSKGPHWKNYLMSSVSHSGGALPSSTTSSSSNSMSSGSSSSSARTTSRDSVQSSFAPQDSLDPNSRSKRNSLRLHSSNNGPKLHASHTTGGGSGAGFIDTNALFATSDQRQLQSQTLEKRIEQLFRVVPSKDSTQKLLESFVSDFKNATNDTKAQDPTFDAAEPGIRASGEFVPIPEGSRDPELSEPPSPRSESGGGAKAPPPSLATLPPSTPPAGGSGASMRSIRIAGGGALGIGVGMGSMDHALNGSLPEGRNRSPPIMITLEPNNNHSRESHERLPPPPLVVTLPPPTPVSDPSTTPHSPIGTPTPSYPPPTSPTSRPSHSAASSNNNNNSNSAQGNANTNNNATQQQQLARKSSTMRNNLSGIKKLSISRKLILGSKTASPASATPATERGPAAPHSISVLTSAATNLSSLPTSLHVHRSAASGGDSSPSGSPSSIHSNTSPLPAYREKGALPDPPFAILPFTTTTPPPLTANATTSSAVSNSPKGINSTGDAPSMSLLQSPPPHATTGSGNWSKSLTRFVRETLSFKKDASSSPSPPKPNHSQPRKLSPGHRVDTTQLTISTSTAANTTVPTITTTTITPASGTNLPLTIVAGVSSSGHTGVPIPFASKRNISPYKDLAPQPTLVPQQARTIGHSPEGARSSISIRTNTTSPPSPVRNISQSVLGWRNWSQSRGGAGSNGGGNPAGSINNAGINSGGLHAGGSDGGNAVGIAASSDRQEETEASGPGIPFSIPTRRSLNITDSNSATAQTELTGSYNLPPLARSNVNGSPTMASITNSSGSGAAKSLSSNTSRTNSVGGNATPPAKLSSPTQTTLAHSNAFNTSSSANELEALYLTPQSATSTPGSMSSASLTLVDSFNSANAIPPLNMGVSALFSSTNSSTNSNKSTGSTLTLSSSANNFGNTLNVHSSIPPTIGSMSNNSSNSANTSTINLSSPNAVLPPANAGLSTTFSTATNRQRRQANGHNPRPKSIVSALSHGDSNRNNSNRGSSLRKHGSLASSLSFSNESQGSPALFTPSVTNASTTQYNSPYSTSTPITTSVASSAASASASASNLTVLAATNSSPSDEQGVSAAVRSNRRAGVYSHAKLWSGGSLTKNRSSANLVGPAGGGSGTLEDTVLPPIARSPHNSNAVSHDASGTPRSPTPTTSGAGNKDGTGVLVGRNTSPVFTAGEKLYSVTQTYSPSTFSSALSSSVLDPFSLSSNLGGSSSSPGPHSGSGSHLPDGGPDTPTSGTVLPSLVKQPHQQAYSNYSTLQTLLPGKNRSSPVHGAAAVSRTTQRQLHGHGNTGNTPNSSPTVPQMSISYTKSRTGTSPPSYITSFGSMYSSYSNTHNNNNNNNNNNNPNNGNLANTLPVKLGSTEMPAITTSPSVETYHSSSFKRTASLEHFPSTIPGAVQGLLRLSLRQSSVDESGSSSNSMLEPASSYAPASPLNLLSKSQANKSYHGPASPEPAHWSSGHVASSPSPYQFAKTSSPLPATLTPSSGPTGSGGGGPPALAPTPGGTPIASGCTVASGSGGTSSGVSPSVTKHTILPAIANRSG